MMMHYVALVRKDDDSNYGVDFPDFPGCISAGATIEEAMAMGREALLGHVAVMVEYGEETPAPSALGSILANPHNCEGLITSFRVPVPSSMKNTVRSNTIVPERVLRQIDAYADERGISRSAGLFPWWRKVRGPAHKRRCGPDHGQPRDRRRGFRPARLPVALGRAARPMVWKLRIGR